MNLGGYNCSDEVFHSLSSSVLSFMFLCFDTFSSSFLSVSHLFFSISPFLLPSPIVSVGYEYESCASLILWEKRTVILQGYELDPTNLGGWSLNKHHILNTRSGTYMYTLIFAQK